MSKKSTASLPAKQNGFSLLEILIAVVIIGFGVVAVGKFFSFFFLYSGFVRQQNIALSLADAKIEDLRAYQSLAIGPTDCPDPLIPNCIPTYDAITTGNETNGEYTISWSITPVTTVGAIGEYKETAVNVTWTDLQNQLRSIQSTSVIGASNPKAAAFLLQNYTPQDNQVHPFNRVLKVPIPAVDQNDGTSDFTPPGTTNTISIDNSSGEIVGGPGIPASIDDDTAYYLLSGFISFGSGSLGPAANDESDINILLPNLSVSDYDCWDDSHLSSDSKAYEDYITYTCVVKGFDSILNGVDVPTWSSLLRLQLDGISNTFSYGWGTDKVCRLDGTLATYANVSETLANQNFMIIKGTRNCPTGSTDFQP